MEQFPRPALTHPSRRVQRERLTRTIAVLGTLSWLWWFVVATAPSAEAVVSDAPVVAPTATTTAALSPGQSAWLALGWSSDRTVTDWSTTVSAPAGVTVTYPSTRGGRDTSLFASGTLVGGTKDFVAFRLSVPYTQTRSFTLSVTSTYRWAPSGSETPKDSPTDHDNGRGNDREAGRTPSPTATPAATPTPTPTPTRSTPSATQTPKDSPTDHDNGRGNDREDDRDDDRDRTASPSASPTTSPTPVATATPAASSRAGSASRSQARVPADPAAGDGRTYSTTVRITVPVKASTDPALTLGTADVVVPAGTSTFQSLTFTGGPGDLSDVAVAFGTLPRGLAVAYPGDRAAAGLNNGSTLVARSTDFVSVRLDTTALPRGTYTLPVVVTYRTTAAQTWTGTVTLRVS